MMGQDEVLIMKMNVEIIMQDLWLHGDFWLRLVDFALICVRTILNFIRKQMLKSFYAFTVQERNGGFIRKERLFHFIRKNYHEEVSLYIVNQQIVNFE